MSTMTDQLLVVIKASSSGAVQELHQLQADAKKTDTAFDSLGKKIGLTGQTLKAGLIAGATALVGTQLVQFLNDSVDAFADSAKAAGELAKATGGSVEEVSRMQAALEDAGISAEQSAALLNKFTTQAGKSAADLKLLGVELVRNKDGSIDYAASMVKVVDAIGQIGDAAERNRLLIQFFGKQGAAVFQELYASGIKLSDAMAAISKYRVFTIEDVKRAVAYDDAMDDLHASTQALQFALGRALVPALSAVAGAFAGIINVAMPLVDVLQAIPGHVYVTVAAVTALGIAIQTGLVAKGFDLLLTALVEVGLRIAGFGLLAAGMVGEMGLMAAASTLATGAIAGLGSALVAVSSVVAPLLLVAAAIEAVMGQMHRAKEMKDFTRDVENLNLSLEEQAQKLQDTDSAWSTFVQWLQWGGEGHAANVQYNLNRITREVEAQAKATLENADATEQQRNAAQALLDVIGTGTDEQKANNLATEEGTAARQEYIEATGGLAAVQDRLNTATKTLNDLLAEGGHSYQEIADAASDAANAQAEIERTTNAAEIAMGQYAVSIQQVIEWQERLAGNLVSIEEGLNNAQEAANNLANTKDDLSTWGDESLIASGKFETSLYDLVDAMAATGASSEQIIAQLQDLRTRVGPEAQAIIDTVIAALAGKTNEIPINIQPTALLDPSVAPLADQINTLLAPLGGGAAVTAPVTQTVVTTVDPVSLATSQSQVSGAFTDTTATINLTTSGYGEVKRVISQLTTGNEAKIALSTTGYGEVKRVLGQLTTGNEAIINLSTRGYTAAKEVIDRLDQDRYVTIWVTAKLTNPSSSAARALTRTQPSAASYIPQQATGPSTRAEGTATVNNNYTIQVEGALDPVGTAQTIERVLKKQDARVRGIPSWI